MAHSTIQHSPITEQLCGEFLEQIELLMEHLKRGSHPETTFSMVTRSIFRDWFASHQDWMKRIEFLLLQQEGLRPQDIANMLDIAQVATELGISVRTVRRHIANNKIQAKKIGGVWRIERNEVERVRKEGT